MRLTVALKLLVFVYIDHFNGLLETLESRLGLLHHSSVFFELFFVVLNYILGAFTMRFQGLVMSKHAGISEWHC